MDQVLDHSPLSIFDIQTPALLLDLNVVEKNCERMLQRAQTLGVELRPHMKTAKSEMVGRMAIGQESKMITVSTVAEAKYFAESGFKDILYAVGISPSKIRPLTDIQQLHGITLCLVVDNVQAVAAVDRMCNEVGSSFDILIEIDSGGGRGGIDAYGATIAELGMAVTTSKHLTLAGVLTHAGHSYGAKSVDEIIEIAETERLAVVTAAARLRDLGFPIRTVSVGSTPTAVCAASLDGVTEMRPGVYMLGDLDQAFLGTCSLNDIALSVLATVIGHNPRSRRILIDAGGLALSKDLSAATHRPNVGYGLICLAEGGPPLPNMFVAEVHQEHGFVVANEPFENLIEKFPVGSQFRVLPNHACMTAAAYNEYHLVRGRGTVCVGRWPKASGC